MTLGNHEFDFGTEQLGRYIRNLTMPMLGACNVDTSAEPALKELLNKYTVLSYRSSKKETFKIGVLGWLTPDTGVTVSTKNLGNVKFLPIVPAVKSCLGKLKAKHRDLDYIIGLSHAGYESDLETAAAVPGLDVIIGGHSHTFLYTPTTAGPIVHPGPNINASNCLDQRACDKPTGPYPTFVGNVPVVQAYYSSKYMGLLKVNLSKRKLVPGVQPLLMGGPASSNVVQPDPDITALLKQYEGAVIALNSQVAGYTQVVLDGSLTVTRKNETNLGNYVCQAELDSLPNTLLDKVGPVNICLLNAGTVRAGIDAPGNITTGQVMAMLPYANAITVLRITGDSLLAAIKHGLSAYPSSGRFLQVAGVRYYHSDGQFLSAVLLSDNGTTAAIQPKGLYNVAVSDYLQNGGDGFDFTGAEVLMPVGQVYNELVLADLQKHQDTGIGPTTHDRIINCAESPTFPGCPGADSSSNRHLLGRRNIG